MPISEQSKADIYAIKKAKEKKFSFLEVLVVLSAIGVIAILTLLVTNPGKEEAEARNVQRQIDLSFILSEVSAYSEENDEIPTVVPFAHECEVYGNEVCKMGPYDCEELVNLSVLNDSSSESITKIPSDPIYISANGTGYYIFHDGEGALTVCAPYAERGEDISFTKYLY